MEKTNLSFKIINEWLEECGKNSLPHPDPKSLDLLDSILSKHFSSPRDIWEEYRNVKGGDFEGWYKSLEIKERDEFHSFLSNSLKQQPNKKQIIKG